MHADVNISDTTDMYVSLYTNVFAGPTPAPFGSIWAAARGGRRYERTYDRGDRPSMYGIVVPLLNCISLQYYTKTQVRCFANLGGDADLVRCVHSRPFLVAESIRMVYVHQPRTQNQTARRRQCRRTIMATFLGLCDRRPCPKRKSWRCSRARGGR